MAWVAPRWAIGCPQGEMAPRIYALPIRHFIGALDGPDRCRGFERVVSGKFSSLSGPALNSIRELGFTHLWLIGVVRHATGRDWSEIGLPPDPPDVLKGRAGSPFAIRDSFDVCPDHADDPSFRMDEFKACVDRVHDSGMRVIIDFVPNHVARTYASVVRPELDFGTNDDKSRFHAPGNHFYYLPGEGPLRLPWAGKTEPGDRYRGEVEVARVTGNNVASPAPGPDDWFETCKLNYGWDYRRGRDAASEVNEESGDMHGTWQRMDAVLAHWQGLGVDGFRCDMAHWIPGSFWRWAIRRARERNPDSFFVAEAYANDPGGTIAGDMAAVLIRAGFDLVYDHDAYRMIRGVLEGPKWANDLDAVLQSGGNGRTRVRYVENQDEVRVAHPGNWGGGGARLGWTAAAVLWLAGQSAPLLFAGQEVGASSSATGMGGDGAGRFPLFEYGSIPELEGWINGGRYDGSRLTVGERELREAYRRLLGWMDHPAVERGIFVPVNPYNALNPDFGREAGEAASGHWVYAWIRICRESGAQGLLFVANLHPRGWTGNIGLRLPEGIELPDAMAARFLWGTDLWTGNRSEFRVEASDGGDRVELGYLEPGAVRIVALPSIHPADSGEDRGRIDGGRPVTQG